MIVAKFGGTSVATAPRIEALCKIIQRERARNPIVVVSALAGVTDLLLSLPTLPLSERNGIVREVKKRHEDIIGKLWQDKRKQSELLTYVDKQIATISHLVKKRQFSPASLDKLASFGEIISSSIVSRALTDSGIKASQVLATNLIITNSNFGSAEFLPKPTEERMKKILKPMVTSAVVPVVTGFIGQTVDGKTTTLGRGASDYTASIIGFCLKVKEIQIWTDVDGIFTADPRIVKNATLIKTISFKEAAELATFGARVLHPRTIKPAIKAGIPVRVLNSFNPKGNGTLIVDRPNHPIRAIAFKRNITLVNIYSEQMFLQKGVLADVFTIFATYGISINLVSVSEVSVSLTLDNETNLAKAINELQIFSSVNVKRHLGIVSLIGEGISKSSHTTKNVFAALDEKGIEVKMISLGATDINISLVVDKDRVDDTVRTLHDIIVL